MPKKDGGIRICVDTRLANEAIKRVRRPISTVEDISFELNGAKYFSKLDLSQVYHQLELDEESRYITTFSTHDFSRGFLFEISYLGNTISSILRIRS